MYSGREHGLFQSVICDDMLFSDIHGKLKYCYSFTIYNNPYVDSFSLGGYPAKARSQQPQTSPLKTAFGLTDDRNAYAGAALLQGRGTECKHASLLLGWRRLWQRVAGTIST